MKLNKVKGAGLFLSVAFLFCVSFSVFAQEALPEGGESPSDALVLAPGDYVYEGDWFVGWEFKRYYKVEDVRPGQKIKVAIDMEDPGEIIMLGLDNSNRQNLIWREASGRDSVSWLAGSEQGSQPYYFAIQTVGFDPYDEFSLSVSKEDFYDAGSDRDAGDDLSSPLEIEEDRVEGYLANKWGDDKVDVYKKKVDPGKLLTVKVTPSMNYYPEVTVFNSSREQILWAEGANKGAIVEETTEEAVESRYVLIKLKTGYGEEYEEKSYTLELTEEKPSLVDKGGEETVGGIPSGPTGGTNFLNRIFGGGEGPAVGVFGLFSGLFSLVLGLLKIVFGLVVLGILIFIVIKITRKKKKPEQTSFEQEVKQEPEEDWEE